MLLKPLFDSGASVQDSLCADLDARWTSAQAVPSVRRPAADVQPFAKLSQSKIVFRALLGDVCFLVLDSHDLLIASSSKRIQRKFGA